MRNKRNRRLLSILLTLSLLVTLLVPMVGPASASVTYGVLNAPTIQTNTNNAALGTISITEDSAGSLKAGDVLTIDLPTNVTFTGVTQPEIVAGAPTGASCLTVSVPAVVGGNANGLAVANIASAVINAGRNSLNITLGGPGLPNVANKGYIYLYYNNVNVGAVNGTVDVVLSSPPGSGFSNGKVSIAATSSGATQLTVRDATKAISSNGTDTLDDIILTEKVIGTLQPNAAPYVNGNNYVKIAAPNGFTWNTAGAPAMSINYQWGFNGTAAVVGGAISVGNDANGKSCLWLPIPAATTSVTGIGRITISNARFTVDESVAKYGDISVRISGSNTNNNVTQEDVVVGVYAESGVTIEGKTTKDIKSGKKTQDIGEFYLTEKLAGSLVNGRTVVLTLPEGAKWSNYTGPAVGTIPVNPFSIVQDSGSATLAYVGAVGTDGRSVKYTVTTGTATKFRFRNGQVDTAPDFTGDLKITVSGTAGATGEVTVAKCANTVSMSADGALKEVKIGVQAQEIGDIIIKENVTEAIKGSNNTIVLNCGPITGAVWANIPTVTVTEGDLVIDQAAVTGTNNRALTIPVKSSSSKPATIKVSGGKVTLDRTVPEGDFKINLAAASTAVVDAQVAPTITTLFPQVGNVTGIVAAKVVTPAPGETQYTSVFKIGDSKFTMNGVEKTMDVAPYVKNDRTYLPIRYVAQALGVADSNIMWNEADQSVVLIKGDRVVKVTIGSVTMMINGVAFTMDVAPEIVDPGRTMLPLRWVAQALGASVNWDDATQTVTVK
ncbi:MAG: hypothetical protein A4E53_01489 [Pelotomaculum sp. PtaB.Bin104]|nr:MAG: hypothetical protein A4E53_01489 [Pelotomaculum sp. PtaB.Bin104]